MNDVEILCKLIEIPSQIGIDNEKEYLDLSIRRYEELEEEIL